MFKLLIVTVLFVVLASCHASVEFALEENGLQTCEFVANTVVEGEAVEEVFFLENVLTLKDHGDFYVLESIAQRELTENGGTLSRQLIYKRSALNGEILLYTVIQCTAQ